MENQVKISNDITKHYWDEKGANQELLDRLSKEIPSYGAGQTLNTELLRAANRLYYDYLNNGNDNVMWVNTVEGDWVGDDEDGYYEEDEVTEWNPYYRKFIDLLTDTFEKAGMNEAVKVMGEIETFIECLSESFEDQYVNLYDRMVDYTLMYVTSHEDKPLPSHYKAN